MWPFGKRTADYDGLGLELLQKAAEYQAPTVDGLYTFLDGSGQLQFRDEMVEKKLLNAAAAVVVAERYARDIEIDMGAGASEHRQKLLDAFYGYVGKLVAMNHEAGVPRIPAGRELVATALVEADRRFPARQQPSSDATHERLTYELARIVLRLHLHWASGNGDRADLPTAYRDWKELSEAASGIGRAQRWVDTSVGTKLRKAMA